jgi:nucleoside-diphosphate-sugar epimerase
MVYVDNLVQGVVRAELTDTAAGAGWWIADEKPYEMREIIATVKEALRQAGLDVADRQIRLPAFVGRVAERADAFVQRTGRYVTQLHVLGEMDKTIACDISVAKAELGYSPTVDLAEGMRRSIAWCRERGIAL